MQFLAEPSGDAAARDPSIALPGRRKYPPTTALRWGNAGRHQRDAALASIPCGGDAACLRDGSSFRRRHFVSSSEELKQRRPS